MNSKDDGSVANQTSIHVHRAVDGDAESLSWVVRRFTPFLLAQAEHRLGAVLRRHFEAEDLAQDVWGVVLRRIGDLRAEEGRGKGALVHYLGRTLLHRLRDLARLTAIRGASGTGLVEDPEDTGRPVVATIIAEERHHVLREAILGLDPKDRAVLVLRGLEGHPVEEVAAVVRSTPGAVAVRYHRALKKLRGIVPPDLLDELADD